MIPKLSPFMISGFDPGETTGYAIIQADKLLEYNEISFEQMLSFRPLATHLWCVERWSLYPHMARTMVNNEFLPVQVIGMIKLRAKELDQDTVFNPAVNVKKFITDDLLKRLGFYFSISPHIRDAIRHALYMSIQMENKK